MSQPRIFVSHSHDDDAFASKLVRDLCAAGAQAWLDKNELGAGDFQERINAALADCQWFVLVLTRNALASVWVKQEVNAANIRKQQRQLSNLIFIKAGPVEHTELPPLWGVYNIFDASVDYASALDSTLRAVGLLREAMIIPAGRFPKRLADLGFSAHSSNGIEYILPPLCTVPAGPFLMVTYPEHQYKMTLPSYEIARFPVTVAEYACFVRAGYLKLKDWQTQLSKLDHPAVRMNYVAPDVYAQWLSEQTGEIWGPANEAEWVKAARGTDRRIYPWGDTFDMARCNTKESGMGGTTAVGKYPNGASPYGVQDMAGNVGEWTWITDVELEYPGFDQFTPDMVCKVHGGAWDRDATYARLTYRDERDVDGNATTGFRLVRAAPSS